MPGKGVTKFNGGTVSPALWESSTKQPCRSFGSGLTCGYGKLCPNEHYEWSVKLDSNCSVYLETDRHSKISVVLTEGVADVIGARLWKEAPHDALVQKRSEMLLSQDMSASIVANHVGATLRVRGLPAVMEPRPASCVRLSRKRGVFARVG